MITRLLHIYPPSDPQEAAEGKGRGWNVWQKKVSHSSSACCATVTKCHLISLRDFAQLQLHHPGARSRLPLLPRGLHKFHSKKIQIYFFFLTFYGNNYSLPLSTCQKHGLSSKKNFKIKRFKRYGWNFQRIQRKKRKPSSFWTWGILIKPTDNHFTPISQRVQAGVFSLTHPFCFSSSMVSRNWRGFF